jgi:hypothetical protein
LSGPRWLFLRIYSWSVFSITYVVIIFVINELRWEIYCLFFYFDLYLDISRSFKCPQFSPMVYLICNYLRSVRYFLSVLREYIVIVHVLLSFEHKCFKYLRTCCYRTAEGLLKVCLLNENFRLTTRIRESQYIPI